MFTPMKPKETRGRKKKYDFKLKKGALMSMPFSTGARTTALRYAKDKGFKYRTWTESPHTGDVTLHILRVD